MFAIVASGFGLSGVVLVRLFLVPCSLCVGDKPFSWDDEVLQKLRIKKINI